MFCGSWPSREIFAVWKLHRPCNPSSCDALPKQGQSTWETSIAARRKWQSGVWIATPANRAGKQIWKETQRPPGLCLSTVTFFLWPEQAPFCSAIAHPEWCCKDNFPSPLPWSVSLQHSSGPPSSTMYLSLASSSNPTVFIICLSVLMMVTATHLLHLLLRFSNRSLCALSYAAPDAWRQRPSKPSLNHAFDMSSTENGTAVR